MKKQHSVCPPFLSEAADFELRKKGEIGKWNFLSSCEVRFGKKKKKGHTIKAVLPLEFLNAEWTPDDTSNTALSQSSIDSDLR